jgi:hypothetical protein
VVQVGWPHAGRRDTLDVIPADRPD